MFRSWFSFNALNIGRYKLGVMCIGGSKKTVTVATQYANERIQFNQPIGNFGAIQHKLAEMAIRTFAGESAMYRTSQLMQDKKAEGIAKANQIINQSLTREYLQHESNLALQKFAEKGGTATVVIPANMQTAPLINIK